MNKYHIIIAFLIPIFGFAQQNNDLTNALKRYPSKTGYIEERLNDVEIKLDKNKEPIFSIIQKDILCSLTDNNLSFVEGKEYYSFGYNLKKIEAYTLVPNLKGYTKMPVKDYKKTAEIGDGLFYDDRFALNFSFPGVCKGSKMVQESYFEVNKPFNPIIFYFGSGLPIQKARISVTFPEDIQIKYKIFGGDSSLINLTIEKKGKKFTYNWTANDIPNYIPETNAPSSRYYIPHLIITISSYKKKNDYIPLFRELKDLYNWNYSKIESVNIDTSNEIKTISDSIVKGATNDLEKVKRIYRWVQKNIRYVAIEDGENGYVPRQASLVLHRRYGDCKDKSSLLKALMDSQKIKASFAWVGTRSLPYKYTEFPSVIVDNHMIAIYWDSNNKPIVLDGTTSHYPIDVIPYSIQGKECLIEKGKDNFEIYSIPITQAENNAIIDTSFLKISSDTLQGQCKVYFTGEPKVNLISSLDETIKENYKNIITSTFPKGSNKLNVDNVTTSNLNNIDDTLKVNYHFNLPNYVTYRNNTMFVNLNLDKSLQETNLKLDRSQPIELDFTTQKKSICILEVPQGYEIQKLPESSNYSNDKFNFNLNYKLSGNSIVLTKTIRVNLLILNKEDFSSYDEMVNLLNKSYIQTIVLRKKI